MTITEEERRRLIGATEDDTAAQPRFERSGVVASLMGMLAGLGMLVLLSATLGAGAILLNLEFDLMRGDLQEMSVVGIIIAAIVILASTMVGGFVAGRTARYGGLLTGFGSALWLALVLSILGGLAMLLGAVSDTFNGFELADRLARFGTADLMTAAAITGGGLLLLALLGGLVGGRLGETRDEEVQTVVDIREVEAGGAEAEGKHEVEEETREREPEDASDRVFSSQQSSVRSHPEG